MTTYKQCVTTTKGTYRLWDSDFIDSVDLSHTATDFIRSMLSDSQRTELMDNALTELTNDQYEHFNDFYVLPGRFN